MMAPQTRTRPAGRTDPELEPGSKLLMPGRELVLARPGLAQQIGASPTVARALSAGRPVARVAARGARLTVAPVPTLGRVAGRYASGQLLSGEGRTDATFWRRGRRTHSTTEGEVSGWSYLCGAERSATRFAATSMAWSTVYSIWPAETVTVTGAAAVGAGALGAWGLQRLRRTREHRRRYLVPLHSALKDSVRHTAKRPEEWLHVPVDFKDQPGTEIRIDLPASFSGDDGSSQHVKTVVKKKLGLPSDTIATFYAEGDQPYATFREPQRAPNKVSLDDIMPFLLKSLETAPIVGIAAGGAPVTVDLEADSPHVLVSGGSGAGKSVLLRAILAQGLAKGAYGIILDIKKVSHMWAKDLPNCEYHRTAESIHNRLLSLRDEIDRRNDLVVEYADEDGNTDHIDVGPRIFLLAEEMNATINRLSTYWRQIKQKGEPNTSPAVEALQELLFMGRQIKIHVLAVAQMASARSMGGPEARENYATRCLARFTNNAWKMLVPEIWPPPKKSTHLGRWQIVRAGNSTETQVAFLSPREARRLATAALPSLAPERTRPAPLHARPAPAGAHTSGPSEDDLSQVSQVPQVRPELGNPPGTVPGDLGQRPPRLYAVNGYGHTREVPSDASAEGELEAEVIEGQRLVGLRQAIDENVVTGVSLDWLRKTRTRDPHHFPAEIGPGAARGELLYAAEELARYVRNRTARDSAS